MLEIGDSLYGVYSWLSDGFCFTNVHRENAKCFPTSETRISLSGRRPGVDAKEY
jgi:hypothetical protein